MIGMRAVLALVAVGGSRLFAPGGAAVEQPAAGPAALPVPLRREVNNSLIIVNFFHKIQNFRQISDLFSQI